MNNELFSRLKGLAQKENRARLAVLLGAAAMLLILLSELFTPYIPIQDFTDKSDIDWSVSIANIDKQLYKKYGLSEEEIID